jgi:hypothetical protein
LRDYKLDAIHDRVITAFDRIILKELAHSHIDAIGRNIVIRLNGDTQLRNMRALVFTE